MKAVTRSSTKSCEKSGFSESWTSARVAGVGASPPPGLRPLLFAGGREARTPATRRNARRGLTLLEIILALTIFFGAMAALSQLAWSGSRAAIQARLKTQAIVRCEAKLAEVLAGIEALGPKSNVAFPDDSKWTYSVSIGDSPFPDLLQVQVTVGHTGNNSLANVQFSLNRWMRDPSIFLDAAEKQQAEADAEAQSQGATQ